MKLPMAKNSLFALLLRSQWWLSIAIAVVLALLAAALLPDAYKTIGAISAATPFIVVGAIAAKRQWGLPSNALQAHTSDAVAAMAWPEFSGLLEAAFKRDGYEVVRTNQAAVDFELARNGRHSLVCARRWKSARIGLESLRALQAAQLKADASEAILISLGDLTDNARPFATEQQIKIWQSAELAQLLRGLLPRPSKPA